MRSTATLRSNGEGAFCMQHFCSLSREYRNRYAATTVSKGNNTLKCFIVDATGWWHARRFHRNYSQLIRYWCTCKKKTSSLALRRTTRVSSIMSRRMSRLYVIHRIKALLVLSNFVIKIAYVNITADLHKYSAIVAGTRYRENANIKREDKKKMPMRASFIVTKTCRVPFDVLKHKIKFYYPISRLLWDTGSRDKSSFEET